MDRPCLFCHKMICESNFFIHSARCQLFLKFDCPICHEKTLYENYHFEQCFKCNENIYSCEQHSCPCDLNKCQYCELDVFVKDLSDHVVWCGARTDECETCHKRIKKSEITSHDCVTFECEKCHKHLKKSEMTAVHECTRRNSKRLKVK